MDKFNMNLDELRRLSGVGTPDVDSGSNISITGNEKGQLMRQHNIQPGTRAWFQLWFSKPYLTGEKPVDRGQTDN